MSTVINTYPETEVVDFKLHPNQPYEKYFGILEDLIELFNNSDDYANLYYLNYKLYRTKFDANDVKTFNELKRKYIPDLY